MKTLGYALSVVVALLLAGALLGGAVSLVWLLAVGDWRLVAMGGGLAVATLVLAPLLLLPSRALTSALQAVVHEGGPRVTVLSVLANGWAALVLGACLLAFLWLLFHSAEPRALLPAALWSYAAATLPWIWLAYRQDRASGGHGGGAALLSVSGMAAYMAGLLSSHYADLGPWELAGVMLAVLGLSVVLNSKGLAGPQTEAPSEGSGED